MRFTPSNLLSFLAVGAILQPVVVPRAITTGLINGRDESGLTKCDVTLGCVDHETIQAPDLEDHTVIPALQKRKGGRPGSNNRPNRNGHGKPNKPTTGPTTRPKPGPTTKPSSVSTTQEAKTSSTTAKAKPTTSSKVHSSTSSKVVSNTRTSSVTSTRSASASTSNSASTTKPVTSSATTSRSQTSAHSTSSAHSTTSSGGSSSIKSEEQSATPSETPSITSSTSTAKPTSEAELTTTSEEAHTTTESSSTAVPTSSEKGSATNSESATTDSSYTPVPTSSETDVSSSLDEYSTTESASTPVSTSESEPTTTPDGHTTTKGPSTPVPTETESHTSSEADPTTDSTQEPTSTSEPGLSHGRTGNKNTSILSWEEYMRDGLNAINRFKNAIQNKEPDFEAADFEKNYEIKNGNIKIGELVENGYGKWDLWKSTGLDRTALYEGIFVKPESPKSAGDVVSENYYNKAARTMVVANSDINFDNTPEDRRLRWSELTFQGWKKHAGDDAKNLRWVIRNNVINPGTVATVKKAIEFTNQNPNRRAEFKLDANNQELNDAFVALAGTVNVKGVIHMLADHHNDMGGLRLKKIHAFGPHKFILELGRKAA
ncbi:hypothetical protein GTR04_0208 [Trichophyton interdigitale]|uniref:SCP domain-containing protein n=1 Tax=Trichophyton interdigitale TaxID=101480 RepID=A0A9P5D077_9EURO|nr:hypothetical protein GY631_1268 [Trichophyton interdigitale]KAF3901255.1 hypothetical protein GY632_0022 [Trichophyton interdigitale]KAG8212381.1 hypothetical protein GTR04_0208 [Trichophyton interdigitale]